jgi:hypothetical protein
MSLFGRDANGNDAYIKASGAGTVTDSFVTYHDIYSNDLKQQVANLNASGDVIGLVSGKKLRILSITMSASQEASIKFQSDGVDDVTGNFYLAQRGTVSISNPLGVFQTDMGEKLNAVITWAGTAGTIGMTVSYREV